MPNEECQLCICLGEASLSALLEQMKKGAPSADLMEIRLDQLADLNLDSIKTIEAHATCPLIMTLRKSSQGGAYLGTEEARFEFFCSLFLHCSPSYIDIEADTPPEIIRKLQDLSPKTKWIISWHDHQETPLDLEGLYKKVSAHRGDYYKIAAFAHRSTDALRMLNFSQKHNQKSSRLSAICMGEYGQSTRVLGAVIGQPFVYASLKKGKETAPGQITAEELINTYHFRSLNRETKLLGLIGRPVDRSFSHLTHNAVLKELGLNALYFKFHLEENELSLFFEEIKLLPIRGLSVTMPYKEKVLPFLHHPGDLTACNTLVWESQGLKGFNTDGIGALRALGDGPFEGKKIMILGGGGTAKAIAKAAHQRGADLVILNRTVEKGRAIAEPIQAKWGGLDEVHAYSQIGYHLIIQATSAGMAPDVNETPVSSEWMGGQHLVLDVISNPPETRFLKEAKGRGASIVSGRELFIHQAVEQFVCWFGDQMPKKEIEEILHAHLPAVKKKSAARVKKSHLKGIVKLPPSKSHTIRAILLGAFTKGTSFIHHYLDSPDAKCAIEAAREFGAQINPTSTGLAITGVAGRPKVPAQVIDAGNSGQVLRFGAALASLSEGYTVITGDESIRSNRPIQPLIDGLRGLNGWAVSTRENGYAPLIVKGPLEAGETHLEGGDSQPVSALLMAAAFIDGKTTINVSKPGEKPWLALTLSWLDRLGVVYSHKNFETFTIYGKKERPSFVYTVPGDLSSIAFPIAAAIVTQSEITIENVDLNDVQGDKELIFLLQKMGASLVIEPSGSLLRVLKGGRLKGQVIDVNDFIDAVPILAVLGCFAEGETELINGSIARKKESNRLSGITAELKKMGASIEETEEGLKVRKSPLIGAFVNSHEDHRLGMSLIVAGLGAEGETEIQGIECINKSFPAFLTEIQRLGAEIKDVK